MSDKVTEAGMFILMFVSILIIGTAEQFPGPFFAGNMCEYFSIFVMPFMLVLTYILWRTVPSMEPMKKNLDSFRTEYNGFYLVLEVFFFYLFLLMLGNHYGWSFDPRVAVAPALSLLIASMALVMEHTKRNFFIGIRTPWTLNSDRVWKKTHLVATPLLFFCAISTLAGALFPDNLLTLSIVPFAGTLTFLSVYSFTLYRKEKE